MLQGIVHKGTKSVTFVESGLDFYKIRGELEWKDLLVYLFWCYSPRLLSQGVTAPPAVAPTVFVMRHIVLKDQKNKPWKWKTGTHSMVNGVGFFCKPSLFQKPAKVHLKREVAGPDLWFNTWTKSLFLICKILFQNTYFVRSVLTQIVMCVSFLKQVSFPALTKLFSNLYSKERF